MQPRHHVLDSGIRKNNVKLNVFRNTFSKSKNFVLKQIRQLTAGNQLAKIKKSAVNKAHQ